MKDHKMRASADPPSARNNTAAFADALVRIVKESHGFFAAHSQGVRHTALRLVTNTNSAAQWAANIFGATPHAGVRQQEAYG